MLNIFSWIIKRERERKSRVSYFIDSNEVHQQTRREKRKKRERERTYALVLSHPRLHPMDK